jgi:hypothetical protein
MPTHTCSADQSKGDTKRLFIIHNLWEEKMCQIHLNRERNLREFDILTQKDIKIGEKTHVPREPSSRIVKNGGKNGRDSKIFKPETSHFTSGEVGDITIVGTILAQEPLRCATWGTHKTMPLLFRWSDAH